MVRQSARKERGRRQRCRHWESFMVGFRRESWREVEWESRSRTIVFNASGKGSSYLRSVERSRLTLLRRVNWLGDEHRSTGCPWTNVLREGKFHGSVSSRASFVPDASVGDILCPSNLHGVSWRNPRVFGLKTSLKVGWRKTSRFFGLPSKFARSEPDTYFRMKVSFHSVER